MTVDIIKMWLSYRILLLKFTLIEHLSHWLLHFDDILTIVNRNPFIVNDVNHKTQSKWIFQILYRSNATNRTIDHDRQTITQEFTFIHAIISNRKIQNSIEIETKISKGNENCTSIQVWNSVKKKRSHLHWKLTCVKLTQYFYCFFGNLECNST